MRVFVTGASGWIGSAVVPELIGAGHQVLGLARSDSSAAAVAALGAEVLRGDLEDLDALRAGAGRRAAGAPPPARAGPSKPRVAPSGTPAVPGRVATERDFPVFGGPAAGRGKKARAVLDLAFRGVRSSVVRMPRSVHGDGDHHGLIARLVGLARDRGVSGYVGDGSS